MPGPSSEDATAEQASFANCVRSDAKRRQSKSCFRKLSDIDIVHRLEMLMRYRCTALHGLSVAYATQELKKTAICITPRRTLPPWICSSSRPLASNCFM